MAEEHPMYTIQKLNDKAVVRNFLMHDQALCAYAQGDLENEMWVISTFHGAFDKQDNSLVAVSLVWEGAVPPVYLLFGDEEAAHALVQHQSAPKRIFFMLPTGLLPILQECYKPDFVRNLWRMFVTPQTFDLKTTAKEGLKRLSADDVDEVSLLFQRMNQTENSNVSISAQRLDKGVFYGIEVRGQLKAIAGTHIYAPQEQVGVVGFVYTDIDARNQGFATATSGAVTQHLFQEGFQMVVLNVEQTNRSAIHAYEKLGYQIHHPIIDGSATKKKICHSTINNQLNNQ